MPTCKRPILALVCAHLSGYGRTGPRAGWPAYDYLAQAEAGYLHLTGEPDGPPTRMGLSIIDYMSGVTMAYALTAALLGAFRSGKGCDVDVTLYDVAMHQLSYPATWYMNEGYVSERRPRSGHPSVVPCEMFPTADGWLFIMCMTPKFWTALCDVIGRPELATDARFRGFAERFANRDALADILDGDVPPRHHRRWMQRLGGRVPAAPVLTLPQALDNPHFHATEGVLTLAHPQRPGPEGDRGTDPDRRRTARCDRGAGAWRRHRGVALRGRTQRRKLSGCGRRVRSERWAPRRPSVLRTTLDTSSVIAS